jgi:hypothetical protein
MNKWISVADRLPEDNRHVIVALAGSVVFVGHYNHGKSKWRLGLQTREPRHGGVIFVSHWMPLPDPPIVSRLEGK